MNICLDIKDILISNLPQILSLRNKKIKKEDDSFVSQGDLLCESLVKDYMRINLPDFYLVSEETPEENINNYMQKNVIILDPIDGTENFVSGLKEWGMAVCVYIDGNHQQSMLALPELDSYMITGDKFDKFESRIAGISSSLSKEDILKLEPGFEYRIIGCAVYNMYNVIKGAFFSFENPKGAWVWDIIPGLNLALENNLNVNVNGKEYHGELLEPNKNIVSELQTTKIYILGKGPTSGKINTSIFSDGIVININDSERIFPGHFCLVHSLWAHESIKANGAKAKIYFSSRVSSNSNWYQLPYEPETFETAERTIPIMENNQLSITDFLFISASKLALEIQRSLSKKMEVYFIGFDFYKNVPNVITDFSDHQPEYTEMVLKTQESVFKTLKKYFSNSNRISFLHVGNRTFSDISIETFNRVDSNLTKPNSLKQNNNLYNILLENTEKGIPIIVAELTNNHIGDENRLRAMIRLAKGAGANAIKVQKRDVDTFYTEAELNSEYESPFGKTLRDYRKGVELDDKLFDVLIEECSNNEIFWFLSILDVNSFEYVQKYDLPLLKLPSTISKHKNFLLNVGNNFEGDLVISTGFTDIEYEKFVLENFTKKRKLFLLQCTSSYPAPPESCQVSVIRHYNNLKVKEYSNIIPGYSSHDVGSMASMMALSAGALMIEKHVKLGDLDWIHFDGVALDLSNNQFRTFVHDMKVAQSICGKQEKEIHSVEHHKYEPNDKSN